MINRDAVVYLAAAQSFAEGLFEEGIHHYRMPLYPLLITTVHFIIPDWIWAARLLNTLALLLCLFPLYFMTLRLFDKKSALATILLFAVLPVFNAPVNSIIRDPLFLLLSLCVLAFLAHQKDKTTVSGVIGVIFLVLFATMIRIEGVLFFALVPLLFIWVYRKKIGLKLLMQGLGFTALLIGISAIILWGLSFSDFATQSRFDEVIFWIKGLLNFEIFSGYAALYDQLTVFQESTPYAHLKNNLVQAARYYAPLIYLIGLIEIIIKEIFPTTILALFAFKSGQRPLFNDNRNIIVWPLLAFMVLNLLFAIVMNFSVTRYMWLPIVLCLPFAGYGISLWWQRFDHRRVALVLLMIFFFVAPAAKTLSELRKEDRKSIRQAGEWIKEYDPSLTEKVFYNEKIFSVYTERAKEHSTNTITTKMAFEIIAGKTTGVEMDIIILLLSEPNTELPHLGNYKKVADFEDKRANVSIYKKAK
ncbi:glycosyltransferase family 39 protein [Patescibacteria group bacterium]|nr:glycosyltransferase family 39 protein [Patescibacteria group bacterium]